MRTVAQKQNQPQKPAASSLVASSAAILELHHRADPILHSKCTIGDQALQQTLKTNAEESEVGSTSTESPRFGHDFSLIPLNPPFAGAIQTKLAINKAGDEYEQEADRISEGVMRMPEPQQPGRGHANLQTKRVQASDTGQTTAPPIVHEVIASQGQPLDPATRAFMEPRFGHDFSKVRVHSGGAAEQSARDVNAHAYTVGRNIVFGAGRFAPDTNEGQQLIAHELTHVVQQRTAGVSRASADIVQREAGGHRESDRQTEKPKPELENRVVGLVIMEGGSVSVVWSPKSQSPPNDATVEHLVLRNWIYRHPGEHAADHSELMEFMRISGEWSLGPYSYWHAPVEEASVVDITPVSCTELEGEEMVSCMKEERRRYAGEAREGVAELGETGAAVLETVNPADPTNLAVAGGIKLGIKGIFKGIPFVASILEKGRKTARALNRTGMRRYLRKVWKKNPILGRLTQAQKATGQARHEQLIDILTEFERKEGIAVQRVPQGSVQAAQGAGNFASLRSRSGVLQIEEQVFKDTDLLMDEVRHELAFHYAGGVDNVPVWKGTDFTALDLLDTAIQGGGEEAIAKLLAR